MRLLGVPAGRAIVIDGLALGVLPEAASELAGRNPLLALVHHPLALESGLTAERAESLRRSEHAALASVRGVIVTSAATARLIISDYAVPAEHVTIARPGSDRIPLAQDASDHRRDEAIRLLSVGAIVPRKGFDVLVAALATLADLPWRLTIAGDLTRDRNAATQLQADIARHGLGERIAVLGAVSPQRLAALYAEADIFALASHFEGYGMAYAEAVAHGLPVIGSNAGAIPDTVPKDAGLLVAPGDVSAFAQALRSIIQDSDLRRRLAGAARAAAPRLPNWRDSAAIFARALETL
jgi:glycosyltransferase involved in cell wall biosynthesis